MGEIPSQLLNLLKQLGDQHLTDHRSTYQQQPKHQDQGLWALQTCPALNGGDQHIQCHRNDHGAEHDQQHPTQIPQQQGQNDRKQSQQNGLRGHRVRSAGRFFQ